MQFYEILISKRILFHSNISKENEMNNLILKKGIENRTPETEVDPILYGRWSPRAMSGNSIPESDFMTIIDAGGWAASSYNEQPWRLIYAKKGTPEWDILFDLLVDLNKQWVKNGAYLAVIYTTKTSTHKNTPFPSGTFSTGSAWQNMALQGTKMGYVVHGMTGFDYEKCASVLQIPDTYKIEAMFTVGEYATSEEGEEEIPSPRKPLREWVFEGKHQE